MSNNEQSNATSPDTASPPFAVLISKDLFFISRITGTAAGFGWKVISDSANNVASHEIQPNCRGFLIDLTTPGLDIQSLVAAMGEHTSIAFGPHVQVKRMELAIAAGCTSVLPRSRFDSTLNEILRSLFDDSSASNRSS